MRAEVIDQDYIRTLTPDLKDYINKFNGEYYGASIDVKADKSRPYKSALHTDMKQVKKARDANNKRNNDVYGSNRANGLLFDVQNAIETKEGWYITNPDLQDMYMTSVMDNREQDEKLTVIEYLNCRAVMAAGRVSELDLYYTLHFELTKEQWRILTEGFNSKKMTKRRIEVLIEMGKLKEFLSKVK